MQERKKERERERVRKNDDDDDVDDDADARDEERRGLHTQRERERGTPVDSIALSLLSFFCNAAVDGITCTGCKDERRCERKKKRRE